MSVNSVVLIGNVGKVDVRSAGDTKVVSMTVATSERYKDRNGEQVENTTWHNVVVWGKSAEFVEKYISKGNQVYVAGKIQNRKYTDKDGVERSVTEIRAESVQNLTRKEKEDDSPKSKRDKDEDDFPF